MRPHATGDLETDPFQGPSHKNGERLPKAFCAGFYDGKKCLTWWGKKCIQDLVAYMLVWAKHHTEKPIVYFHNGGKFDAHFMLAEMLIQLRKIYGTKELKLFCIGSRIVEIETPDFSLRCSYALIPKPLKSFSDKKEIEIEKLEPEVREKHRTEILSYLRQDCIGLFDGLSEFFKLYGCGLTLASTAFKILGKDFGGKIKRTDESYDAKFRKAFFAGRVQFYALGKQGLLDGKKRFEIVDINSSFPYAMTFPHWFSDKYTILKKPIPEFKNECFYEVVCDSAGVLPVRTKDGLDFPHVKQQEFFVVGYELWTGVKLGLIKNLKIKYVYLPEETNDFAEYVNYFYKLKKEAKTPAEREFAKLFLNAVYGKFAQNSRDFTDSVVTEYGQLPEPRMNRQQKDSCKFLRKEWRKLKKKVPMECAGHSGWHFLFENVSYFIASDLPLDQSVFILDYWNHLYDDLQRGLSFWSLPAEKKEHNAGFNNVAIGASITALARAKLAEAMAACEGVLYCDTDSILAKSTKKLTKGDGLGEWKLEKECDAIWIGGKKLYVAHSIHDKGLTKKPKGKVFCEVHLPKQNFHRFYLTKKDFDSSWKKAAKGVRLKIEDLIAVCEGEERKYSFDAPNYSVKSAPHFITRTVRRDDQRKKKK